MRESLNTRSRTDQKPHVDQGESGQNVVRTYKQPKGTVLTGTTKTERAERHMRAKAPEACRRT